MEDKVKNTRIQEIFQTMEYGENFEKTENAIEWINTKTGIFFAYVDKNNESPNGTPTEIKNRINGELLCTLYIPEITTVKNILSKSNGKIKWIDTKPFERAKLLNNLAREIENNADILSQIEIISRGILSKDTRNTAVPLLAQYFYYYSGFTVKHNQENPNWKPEGIAVGVISNENTLSNLGLLLAPALAAGYNIILQVGTKLCPVTAFILDLAEKVGIPKEVLRIIPSDNGELLPYLSSDNVAVLTLFVDLHNEKYLGINNFNKKILNLSSYRTPVIVFDDADLDSSSASIIDSAWGYQGLLPWSVNTILVQENIFEPFLNKIKTKLRFIKVGLSNNRMVDISVPSDESVIKLKKLTELAKSQGIQVFQTEQDTNTFTPTLFIGGKVQTNKVLAADEDQETNVVTVLAFRNIDEAVNLANNTRQGLAASIWSENIGVVNEVTRKLKDSGVGYFGGKEGFYEYAQIKKNSKACSVLEEPQQLNSSIANAVITAKNAKLNDKWLENWITDIYECITDSNMQSYSISQLGFNITSLRDPRGVVGIETIKEFDAHNIKLILSALFEGNSVILLNNCNNAQFFYTKFSQMLPSGVLNVFPYNLENVKTIAVHKELNAYFGDGMNPIFSFLPIKDCKVFTNVLNDWADVYKKVTFFKKYLV
ncbi:hypothetical protein NQ314_009679 [Rhamnusium bicolor]|uniref:Aldehyde dehydrogenase domain-containing protein n=1 Tax=Rhamnusium bicolor TaxID=1586634 RepID=A0AAV8XXQ4_9CUCU|nr:hypothetical protein NQ314_009679 [Rhamnusium bicolor]